MREPPMTRTPTTISVALAALALANCVGGARSGRRAFGRADASASGAPTASADAPAASGEPTGSGDSSPRTGPVIDSPVVLEDRWVGVVSPEDFAEFKAAWVLFVRHDRNWPEARDRWLKKGGAAPNVLAENLLRYFLSATAYGRVDAKTGSRRDINWVAASARKVGEPAVGYFASLLILDERPLDRPVVARDSDGKPVEHRVWTNDDVTRRDLSTILSAIGEPAVPTLATDAYLRQSSQQARRYVMRALGRIGTDRAVDALASMLTASDWQDRGVAVAALGHALVFRKNERARAALERAKGDPDEFVRKKAADSLAGRLKEDA